MVSKFYTRGIKFKICLNISTICYDTMYQKKFKIYLSNFSELPDSSKISKSYFSNVYKKNRKVGKTFDFHENEKNFLISMKIKCNLAPLLFYISRKNG
ncbi:hypothetical protein RIR_jg40963.t1 [Rhizophagus irregularis DAOM 181602=DAOM 197198]|nr:hypothetical protein RIR_jg40963.t1 [Rhizophagus irregularis DAOM 181602=DAOM 197198]